MTQSTRERRFRSKQERRGIVEETLKPGASASQVVRAHDINRTSITGTISIDG